MPEQKVPSVGRIVHWFPYGTRDFPKGPPRAALITEVDEPDNPTSPVGLCVFNPLGTYFTQHVHYGPGTPGHWAWPSYVPPVEVKPVEVKE